MIDLEAAEAHAAAGIPPHPRHTPPVLDRDRRARIQQLRDLADLLTEWPDIPLPEPGDIHQTNVLAATGIVAVLSAAFGAATGVKHYDADDKVPAFSVGIFGPVRLFGPPGVMA